MCSQPSVTVHIQQLESSLGVQLFHRENNRVTLTEAGRYFQTEADQLLQQLDTSFNRLHHFTQGYRRTWQIAISPLMAETMLPYFLKTFQRRHPDVALTIRVEDSKEIEHLVAKDIVQLGVSALDSTSKVLQSQRIYEDPVIFVAPLDQYDDESGPPIDVKEMLQHHYVFTHHHPV